MFSPVVLATVVPDKDGQRSDDDEGQVPVPSRSQTPPTPPVQAASPPACSRPSRQRAMAQLRPVSIPEIVRDMVGSDPLQKIADLDRHYMPEGQPAAEVSLRGTSDAHRAELKTNAAGISRSLSEVFAYLKALAPDRFWNTRIESEIAGDDEGPCMGIELNIWERMKVNKRFYVYHHYAY